jgi:putative endonuclease
LDILLIIVDRIRRHNSKVKKGFTAKANDWELVYKEAFADKSSAMPREKEINAKKSRKYIEWLISNLVYNIAGSTPMSPLLY